MGKSTLNGRVQWQTVSLPEGNGASNGALNSSTQTDDSQTRFCAVVPRGPRVCFAAETRSDCWDHYPRWSHDDDWHSFVSSTYLDIYIYCIYILYIYYIYIHMHQCIIHPCLFVNLEIYIFVHLLLLTLPPMIPATRQAQWCPCCRIYLRKLGLGTSMVMD